MQLIEPEYMKKFSCLADACPDTCCSGWDIIFDEAACSRYRESQDTALREAFHQNVLRNEEPAADGTIPFARVKLTEKQSCPYLRTDGLCTIQRRTEENNLSETCRTHPRVVQFWGDGYAEVSLQLSCPMASELVLSDQPLCFSSRSVAQEKFKGLRYRQESSQCGISFRNFLITILQWREYGVQERLYLANHFFWEAAGLNDDSQPAFFAMVDGMLSVLADRKKVRTQYGQRKRQPAMQLEILRSLLLHRLQSIEDDELKDLPRWLFVHWALDGQITSRTISLYEKDCSAAEPAFFTVHAQAAENYLVNQVFKAGNLLFKANGADQWIFLVFQYALQRFLLSAAIARSGNAYSLQEAQHLVQKITKFVEHDMLYQQQCVQFIRMLQLDHEAGLGLLCG